MRAIFIVLLMLSTFSFAQPLIVTGEDWPPFEFKKDGEVVGIDVDISREIFKTLGIEPEYKIQVWKRAWKMVEDGEADAVFSTSRKEKRKPFVIYPEENMWMSEYVFLKSAGDTRAVSGYQEAEDKGLSIGTIKGNSYNDEFWEHELNLHPAINLETNIKKLAGGRIDLVIVDKTIGLYTAKLLGLRDKIDFHDAVLFAKGYPMPFVKNSDYPNIEGIAEKYEAELKKMKQDGRYQAIMDKWLN